MRTLTTLGTTLGLALLLHAPAWAQTLGELLPTTHFMRIVRGLMLKGADFSDIRPELGALMATLIAVSALAISRYRVTLDGPAKPAP